MQPLHVQIFAGVVSVALVATGLGAMTLHASKREVDRKVANAEKEIAALRAGTPPPAQKSVVMRGDPEKENRDLLEKVRILESRVAALEKENAMLREAVKRAQGVPSETGPSAAAPAAPRPSSGGGLLAAAPRPAAPPQFSPGSAATPPAPEPQAGIGEQSELGEMATALKLVPEQREELRRIWKEYQDDFDRLLNDANAEATRNGTRDMAVFDRIGAQARHNFDQRVDQMLYPEQKDLHSKWKKKRDAAEVPR